MVELIVQCVVTLLTALVAGIQLGRDFRKRDNKINKEAKFSLTIIVITALCATTLQTKSYFDNQDTQDKLQTRLDSLKAKVDYLNVQNDSLSNQNKKYKKEVIKEVDSRSQTIALQASNNALVASHNLSKTADRLALLIRGSDTIPLLRIDPGNKFSVVYKNPSSFPVYNLIIKLINYDSLKSCRIDSRNNKQYINNQCFERFSNAMQLSYLDPGGVLSLDFPFLNNNSGSGHLEIFGSLSNKDFIQQLVWIKYTARAKIYAVRTLVKNSNGDYKTVNIYNNSNLKVNWGDFSLPNNLYFSN